MVFLGWITFIINTPHSWSSGRRSGSCCSTVYERSYCSSQSLLVSWNKAASVLTSHKDAISNDWSFREGKLATRTLQLRIKSTWFCLYVHKAVCFLIYSKVEYNTNTNMQGIIKVHVCGTPTGINMVGWVDYHYLESCHASMWVRMLKFFYWLHSQIDLVHQTVGYFSSLIHPHRSPLLQQSRQHVTNKKLSYPPCFVIDCNLCSMSFPYW